MRLIIILVALLVSAGATVSADNGPGCSLQTVMINGKECLVLKNAQSSLVLDAKRFTLVEMIDRAQNLNYVVEPGGSLFSISFLSRPKEFYQTDRAYSIDGRDAEKCWYENTVTGQTRQLKLHYDGCPVGENGRTADVTVTVSIRPDDPVFRWSLALKNQSGFTLDEVRFPTLRGLGSKLPGSDLTDYVAVPYDSGRKVLHPRSSLVCNDGWTNYPGYAVTIQMLMYCDGQNRGGFYLAAEDIQGYRKCFFNEPMASGRSFVTYVLHYPDGASDATGNWTLPYSVAAGPLAGDHYDAAKLYRKWMISTNHWLPLSKRTDIPQWYLDLSVWVQGFARWDLTPPETMDQFADNLIKFRQRLGEDIIAHWYMWWHGKIMDKNYPDYLPSQPGFKEAIAKVQKAGIYVMPYVNINRYETTVPMWQKDKASQWAIQRLHTPAAPENGAPGLIVSMCPFTDYWQGKLASIYGTLVKEYGIKVVYLDELHMYPAMCYATNHGHPALGGGNHFAQGMRKMIERIKAESGLKQLVLTGEACTETYADLMSGQLSGYVDLDADPLFTFQAAMSDRTIDFGMRVTEAEGKSMPSLAAKVGFSFVNGRQLWWGGPDLVAPGYEKQMAFLVKLAQARKAGQAFLLYGEFLRKPDLSALPRHEVVWWEFNECISGKAPNAIQLSEVMASVYRAENGDIGLVLVNITPGEVTVKIPNNPKDWGLVNGAAYKVSEFRDNVWGSAKRCVMTPEISVKVPAYSPVMLRYQAVRN